MFLGFNRLTLASHICYTDLIPWVHHSREEGSLDYDERLVRLQVYLNFNTKYTVNNGLALAFPFEPTMRVKL
jgi:hypothetical protein